MTEILTAKQIKKAAEYIKKGKLVAFPTETVYGLGANALNETAVKKIFKAKGRPADNPLIVHISDEKQLKTLVQKIPNTAKKLMKKFWPGPLSIVFKKTNKIPNITTAGLDTVVIRMPDNKIARKLITLAGVPIAAPSANTSGKPSPTRPEHVIKDLSGKIDAIILGGKCKKGLESTVIDVRNKTPTILRLGSLTVEEIEKIIGKIKIDSTKKISPGTKYRHYAPDAKLILAEKKDIEKIFRKYENKKIITLTKKQITAKKLYHTLRTTEADIIIAPIINEKGINRTIMERLKRASN